MSGTPAVHYGPDAAIVVVDVQNDFADPAGNLYVGGGEEVVPIINEEIARARSAGATVAYTQDWHPPVTPHFQKDGGVWPVHCVQGTWGAELHPGLTVAGPVVKKGARGEDGYSGFGVRDPVTGEEHRTELASMLEQAGIRRVVVVGLAGDVCVAATAMDAAQLGFETTVLKPATRAVEREPGDEERAFEQMRAAGIAVVE